MARAGRAPVTAGLVVYVLRCADGSLYTGWTTDLERRLQQHRAARASKYTRSRLPVELAGFFKVRTRTEARRLEARFKALPRARKLKMLE
jgi:putative endonuclease